MKKIVVIGLASIVLAACGNGNSQSESTTDQTSKENSSVTETSKSESKLIDTSDKREIAFEVTDQFLEVVVNEDTKDSADKQIREKRRKALEPYVTDEVLKDLEPSDEELKEQGFPLPVPAEEKEYDPTVSPVTNLMEYKYELEDRNIYIDEESLTENTIYALADVFFTFETDMEGNVEEYDEFRTYQFNLENVDGDWVISEYEIIRNERFKPESERQG